ncbi:hypothetical protein HPP92_025086 [Vanilla planifolia]|uniref:Uncharacterized protein n=1 Tax=Vanilla planifolia TaxID=51239 RepID=A0A835PLK8_VANPL|nr:hypothetical protein HPP92_025086 [Vanilla planifolia]
MEASDEREEDGHKAYRRFGHKKKLGGWSEEELMQATPGRTLFLSAFGFAPFRESAAAWKQVAELCHHFVRRSGEGQATAVSKEMEIGERVTRRGGSRVRLHEADGRPCPCELGGGDEGGP